MTKKNKLVKSFFFQNFIFLIGFDKNFYFNSSIVG